MAKRDLIVAIILTLIGLLILILIPYNTIITGGKPHFLIEVSPRTFPFFSALLMLALGVINLVTSVINYQKVRAGGEDRAADVMDLRSTIPVFLAMVAYAAILTRVGYLISTFSLAVFMAIFFKAKPWQIILAGVVVPLIAYLLFTKVGVPLPRGIFYL